MPREKSAFLDVSPEIIERKLLLKDDNDEFEKALNFTQNSVSENEKTVIPVGGFVVKTQDVDGNKVFINLCKLDDIPEPKKISDEELMNLLDSDNPSNYRVPISIQEPHDELDKSGKKAVVYDVAVNSKYFEMLRNNDLWKLFTLDVVQTGVENKFNVEFKRGETRVLQNRKCIGVLRPHRIRLTKGAYQPPKRLIQEINSSDEIKPNNVNPEDVNYRLLRGNSMLLAQFYLPRVNLPREVVLETGEDRLILESLKFGYHAEVFLPSKVNEYRTVANFNQSSKVLTVLMPCDVKS